MNDPRVFFEIKNGYVEGVDISKRADSLKNFLVKGETLRSTKIKILEDINLRCEEGEKIALIGSNGCGKSSLLKVIAGIYPLKSGSIKIRGSLTPIIEMGVGFEPELTGRQNIKILALYNDMLHLYDKKFERDVIEFSELGDKIELPLKNYSSGMMARLAFAASIFQNPDILLLDEVFAVGDANFVNKSLETMKRKFGGAPISILVAHQESMVKETCGRCILLREGSIIFDGDPDEAFKLYDNGNY